MTRVCCNAILILFLVCGGILADNSGYSSKEITITDGKINSEVNVHKDSPSKKSLSANYDATLRVYVIEPVSRWRDYNYSTYENGFLGFAFYDTLSIPYLGTFEETRVWSGSTHGYGDIAEDNIMVIAVISGNDGEFRLSYPGDGSGPFTAYFPDAVTGAHPGETGIAGGDGNYTHSVLFEEGTRTT
ncbi:MAG: hypothetical protein ABIE07_03420 [Candidatus Zixiibacteriota bacterium]